MTQIKTLCFSELHAFHRWDWIALEAPATQTYKDDCIVCFTQYKTLFFLKNKKAARQQLDMF